MIHHHQMGSSSLIRMANLKKLVKSGKIRFAGNFRLKIYGVLKGCYSGKRMKVENRVFFKDEKEAKEAGFRPCGNCLPEAYKAWKPDQRNI